MLMKTPIAVGSTHNPTAGQSNTTDSDRNDKKELHQQPLYANYGPLLVILKPFGKL